jgi:hypothetical protein
MEKMKQHEKTQQNTHVFKKKNNNNNLLNSQHNLNFITIITRKKQH